MKYFGDIRKPDMSKLVGREKLVLERPHHSQQTWGSFPKSSHTKRL